MAIKFQDKNGDEPEAKKQAGKSKPAPQPDAPDEAGANATALPFAKPVRAEKGRKAKR